MYNLHKIILLYIDEMLKLKTNNSKPKHCPQIPLIIRCVTMNTWQQMWGKTYQCQISNARGWFIGVRFSKFHDFSMTFQSSMTFQDFSRKFYFSRFSRPRGNPGYICLRSLSVLMLIMVHQHARLQAIPSMRCPGNIRPQIWPFLLLKLSPKLGKSTNREQNLISFWRWSRYMDRWTDGQPELFRGHNIFVYAGVEGWVVDYIYYICMYIYIYIYILSLYICIYICVYIYIIWPILKKEYQLGSYHWKLLITFSELNIRIYIFAVWCISRSWLLICKKKLPTFSGFLLNTCFYDKKCLKIFTTHPTAKGLGNNLLYGSVGSNRKSLKYGLPKKSQSHYIFPSIFIFNIRSYFPVAMVYFETW